MDPEKSAGDMVAECLSEASISTTDSMKVQNLCKVQDIVLNKEPVLLNVYLDDILQFAMDRNVDVKKTICGFIEDTGVKKPDAIPRLILVLLRLITDPAPVVAKRALRASRRILTATLKWASSAQVVTPDMKKAWLPISDLKIKIVNMIDSDNDGIRTQALKFLEGVVLIQTYPDPDLPKKPEDFSLEDVPLTLKIARRSKLEEEANHVVDLLIMFFGVPRVSSVNLITCMGSLSLIAKMRPKFMPNVIQAMQTLQSNLPPTLSDSQVTSVQKQLKLTLFGLLKHPASVEYAQPIAKQLTQLGCKKNEILKYSSKPQEIRRVKKRQQENATAIAAKKERLEIPVTPMVAKEQQAKVSLEAHEKSSAKAMKLSEVTKPLLKETRDKMLLMAVKRILETEKSVVLGGVADVRMKTLTTLAVTSNPYVKDMILLYITEDMRTRLELALCWLYEEYALLKGFQRRNVLCSKPTEAPDQAYNDLLCTLVLAIDNIQYKDRYAVLSRLYLEAPLITEDAVKALKIISSKMIRGLMLFKNLVIRRPTKKLIFLNVLLCYTGHENDMKRENAIQLVVRLYARPGLSKLIEEYSVIA